MTETRRGQGQRDWGISFHASTHVPHHELDRGEQGFEEPVFIWGQVGKLSDKNTTTNGFGATKQLSCQSSDSLVAQMVKNLAATQETRVRSLGWEDTPEKGMATHSSILAWRIPWTEEPGGIQSMGSQRVRHN